MVEAEAKQRPGQDLLAAYRAHTGPSPEAVERLAAALRSDLAAQDEVPAAAQSFVAASDAGASEVGGAVIDLAARTRNRRGWIVAAGLLAIAAAIGLLALGPSLTQQHAQRDDPAAAFHQEPGAARSARARAPATAPEAPAIAVDPETAPQARAADLTRRRPLEATAPETADIAAPPASEPSLAEEMQRMRPAQAALVAGDPSRALELLEDYVQAFPDGLLHEEYLALRAIARCSAGPPPAGRAEADAFLNARPRSMFAERVRGACDPR